MRLTKVEQFKPLVGKEIIAIGTGNNARNGGIKRTFTVKSIARKYVNLDGVNYCPQSGATQGAISAGYGVSAGFIFFASQQDADDYVFEFEKRCELRAMTRGFLDWTRKLSLDEVVEFIEKIKGDKNV